LNWLITREFLLNGVNRFLLSNRLRDAIDKMRLVIFSFRPGNISELTIPTIVRNGFTAEKNLIPELYVVEGEPY